MGSAKSNTITSTTLKFTKKATTGFKIDKGVTDVLKIFSALLVLTHHYLLEKTFAGYEENVFELAIRSLGGNIGVAIFFFLSGYGLMMSEMKSHLSFSKYVRRRFLKIYLPVILATALWLPLYYMIVDAHTPTFWEFTQAMLWTFNDPIMWFIRILILLYAAFYLYAWIAAKQSQMVSLIVMAISAIAICAISFYINGDWGLESMSAIPLFFIGVLAAGYAKTPHFLLKATVLLAMCILARIACCYSDTDRISLIAHSLADYSTIWAILLLFSRYNPRIQIPGILALVTFDVYLLHFKVLMTAKAYDILLPYWLFLTIVICMSFLFNFVRRKFLHI